MLRVLLNPLISSTIGALVFGVILFFFSKDSYFAIKWSSLYIFVAYAFSSLYFFSSLLIRDKVSSNNYLYILLALAISTSLLLAYIASAGTLHGENPFREKHLTRTLKIFALFVSTSSLVAFISWLQVQKTNKVKNWRLRLGRAKARPFERC